MSDSIDNKNNATIEETIEQLSTVVDANDSDASTDASSIDDTEDTVFDTGVSDLLNRADEAILSLIVSLGDGTVAQEDIAELRSIVEEAAEMLETVDLTELSEAIDYKNIDEAIDLGDVPAAIAKGDPEHAIQYRKLLMLVEFGKVLDAVDLSAFKQNKDDFGAAIETFLDDRDEDDEWSMVTALKWLTETIGEDGDEGLLNSIDPDMDDMTEMDGQMKQEALQAKLGDAVEEFREGILDAHDRMEDLRDTASEQVSEATGNIGQPSSRNPTAYSTLPAQRTDRITTTGVSTVPQNTRYSTAMNLPRIYGSRFDSRRDDDE